VCSFFLFFNLAQGRVQIPEAENGKCVLISKAVDSSLNTQENLGWQSMIFFLFNFLKTHIKILLQTSK
jgi:hypothetical protein